MHDWVDGLIKAFRSMSTAESISVASLLVGVDAVFGRNACQTGRFFGSTAPVFPRYLAAQPFHRLWPAHFSWTSFVATFVLSFSSLRFLFGVFRTCNLFLPRWHPFWAWGGMACLFRFNHSFAQKQLQFSKSQNSRLTKKRTHSNILPAQGEVAQRQSKRLIIARSWVQIPPSPHQIPLKVGFFFIEIG